MVRPHSRHACEEHGQCPQHASGEAPPAKAGREEVRFQVELYNLPLGGLTRYGSPRFANGWLVARIVGGRRCETVTRFGTDEVGARKFCEGLNRDFGVKGTP